MEIKSENFLYEIQSLTEIYDSLYQKLFHQLQSFYRKTENGRPNWPALETQSMNFVFSHHDSIFSYLNSYFYSSEVAKTFCMKLSGLCIGLLPHSKSKLYAKNL